MTNPQPAIRLLRAQEWSMGNGQCPSCHGVPPDWFGHPCYLTPDRIGHRADCGLAAALFCLNETVLYLGDFKSSLSYETCLTNGCLDTKAVGEPLHANQQGIAGFVDRFTEMYERAFLEHLTRKYPVEETAGDD